MGCRSILGEGLHLGKVRQLKVTRDVSVPKPLPVKKGGHDTYFAVNCFSLFVPFGLLEGMGGKSILSFHLVVVLHLMKYYVS